MDIAFAELMVNCFRSEDSANLLYHHPDPTFSESNVGSTKSIWPGKSQMENWTKEELATSSLTILLVLSRKSVSFGDILWKTTWRKERERLRKSIPRRTQHSTVETISFSLISNGLQIFRSNRQRELSQNMISCWMQSGDRSMLSTFVNRHESSRLVVPFIFIHHSASPHVANLDLREKHDVDLRQLWCYTHRHIPVPSG